MGIAQQVDHVQKILTDQESMSRSARVLQPVDVAELARESVNLLGTDIHRAMNIKFDPSLQAVGPGVGFTRGFTAILINLLKNAAGVHSCMHTGTGHRPH